MTRPSRPLRQPLAAGAAVLITAAALTGCGSSGSDAVRPTPAVQGVAPPALHGRAARASRAVTALERALRDGDVEGLCRPGALLTRAVVREVLDGGTSCEAALESSPALAHPPTLTIVAMSTERDLARARVRVNGRATVPLDLVRVGRRWLVSFSGVNNPVIAIEQ